MSEQIEKSNSGSVPLPDHVRALMWEYGDIAMRWPEDSDTIIRKILDAGNWDSIRWLIATAGHETLRNWISDRQGAGLDPKKLRFWQTIVDIPSAAADDWVRLAKLNPWGRRMIR